MTDASELAQQVIPPARAAIGAYGTAALTRDAEHGADEEVELGREVLQEIYWRAKPVEPFEVAVTGLAADPEDADAVGALRLQVKKALEADEVLTVETAKLVEGPTAGDTEGVEDES